MRFKMKCTIIGIIGIVLSVSILDVRCEDLSVSQKNTVVKSEGEDEQQGSSEGSSIKSYGEKSGFDQKDGPMTAPIVEDDDRLIDDFIDEETPRIVSTSSKWSLEDKSQLETSEDDDSSSGSTNGVTAEDLMSETERVVEAIKRRFANSDVIQVVEPPQLQQPGGGGGNNKKFRLVLNQQTMTPVEPITNLLNKRKEPEVPREDELFGNSGEEQNVVVDEKGIHLKGRVISC
jgi:hypothetical protein